MFGWVGAEQEPASGEVCHGQVEILHLIEGIHEEVFAG